MKKVQKNSNFKKKQKKFTKQNKKIIQTPKSKMKNMKEM